MCTLDSQQDFEKLAARFPEDEQQGPSVSPTCVRDGFEGAWRSDVPRVPSPTSRRKVWTIFPPEEPSSTPFTRRQQAIADWTGSKPRFRVEPEHGGSPRWIRRKASKLLRQSTRRMPPGAKRVAQVLAADMVAGQYFKRQEHLGKRAHLSRQWTNRYLQLLAKRGIITISKRQRLCVNPERDSTGTVAGPKTLTLSKGLLDRLFACKSQGDTSEANYSVMFKREQVSTGRAELEHVLARAKRKRLSSGTWSACCPAHDDHNPSLAVTIGRRGQLLLHCFAGCHFLDIRAAFGLPAPVRWAEVAS